MYHGPPLPPTNPCFCGDRTTLSEVDEVVRVRWQVQCDDDQECGARGPMKKEPEAAVVAWNEIMPRDSAWRREGYL